MTSRDAFSPFPGDAGHTVGGPSVAYVSAAGLPTPMAHGYQIAKMCEAFALEECRVTLLNPHRRYREIPAGLGLFAYYGIAEIFSVRNLPRASLIRLQRWLTRIHLTAALFGYEYVWALHAGRTARALRADLYYTRQLTLAYWLTRLGLPTVYEVHEEPRRRRHWLVRAIAAHPALRGVVVLTSYLRDRVSRLGIPADRIRVLPDAADLSMFENLPTKEWCRLELGLPLDRPIVGYIGTFRALDRDKGVPELLRAFSRLPSAARPPLLLCVGGPTALIEAYRTLSAQLGLTADDVQFVDRVPNSTVPRWMHACDVATVPWTWTEFSAYFTSPLKVFEYFAAGVPVVSSDLPALREVLRDGENALLVPPGDADSLARAIGALLADPQLAARLSAQGLRDAKQHTWRNRARTILSWMGVETPSAIPRTVPTSTPPV